MTGAWTDPERGLVSVIVLEMGGSSDLCALLKPGEPVVLMGPTGTPTEIPAGKTVALVGGGLGNAVLFSIGAALRAAGSRVLYFAGYKRCRIATRWRRSNAPPTSSSGAATRSPVSCPTRSAAGPQPSSATSCRAWRPMQLAGWARRRFRWRPRSSMIVIGSDRMMQAVGVARHGVLAPYLKPGHTAIGSIN